MGCPKTPNQINIVVFWLKKLKEENLNEYKIEEILNLFVILYLKCSKEIQLTLVDDIDKSIEFI